ncbi:MAG: hypothetical protein ACHQT6_07535 [Candidatus Acidiferrales bacterium]
MQSMQSALQDPEKPEKVEKRSPVTLIIGGVVAFAILLSLWFLLHVPLGGPVTYQATVSLKMAPAEQAYLKNICIEKIALSRAENFIHQEVTILSGEVVNDGPEKILHLSLTVEFADSMNQIALRETRGVLGAPSAALSPGERRPFEISFDHVPSSWNMQQPYVHASYLQVSHKK